MKKLLLFAFTILTIGVNAQNKVLDFNTGDINLASFVGGNLRTLECWFKLDTQIDPSLATIQTLMYRPNAGNTNAFGLYFGQSTSTGAEGRLVFVRRIGSSNYKVVSDNNTWAANEWHHVAGVIDPTTGMTLYIDGVLQSSTHTSLSATSTSSVALHVGSFGNSTRYFDGQLDNIGLWKRALLPGEIQNHAAALCYTFNPSTQTNLNAFYNFETDALNSATVHDLSPNALNGNRSVNNTSLQTGTCFVPNPPALNSVNNYSAGINNVSKIIIGGSVGNGVRSIECWFKLDQAINGSLASTKTLIYRNSTSGNQDFGLYFGAHNWSGRNGRLVFNRSGGNSLNYVVSDQNTWAANEWHHVVGVIDPVTGMALFIDGVKQASTKPNSKFAVNTKTTTTQIGAWGTSTSRYFNGNIDGVRLWDRALTQSEMDLNRCGFDPAATQTGLIAYYDFDGSTNTWLNDKSGNNHHASTGTTAATQDVGQSCYKPNTTPILASLQLNGTGAQGKLTMGTADNLRTIECWFKLDDAIDNTLVTTQTLIVKSASNGYRDFGLFFGQSSWSGREGKLVFVRRIASSNYYIVSNSNTWAANVWHHVAGVIDPIYGMQLFIDGVKQTDTHSSTQTSQSYSNSYNPTIGVWGQSGRYFKGEIDEIRFWNRALTVTEINANNCNSFDPSTQTGLTGYWNFDQSSGSSSCINLVGSNNMNLFSGATRVSADVCGNLPAVPAVDTVITCNGLPYQWIDSSYYHSNISSGVFHTIIGGAANGSDSIVELNLTIGNPATATDVQTACGSYTWIDGNTYNSSNNTATYTVSGATASGCDSIYTLNLTINTNDTLIQNVNSCGSYTWINGTIYNASINNGLYIVSGVTASGCDSIYILHLTINTSETVTETISACGSYTWRDGVNYSASNNSATFTVSGATANGCDSIYTLNLTINNDIHVTDTISACNNYTWRNGTQYSNSVNVYANTFTVSGATATGCDSVYHLVLTVTNDQYVTETISACGSYTWRDGVTYNATTQNVHMYVVSGATASGCDSVYTLDLTINSSETATETITACGSYTWRNGTTYNANNTTATYTVSSATVNGCDSIYTLNLTIGNNETATETIATCGNYTWRDGVNYTASNTSATFTVSGATTNGCDSIYTLNLTINVNETATETITACNSYTWKNGITYNTSNTTATYTVTGATSTGCDSVYTLNLTINNNETVTENITACGSYTWRDGLVYSASNTTATFTVSGATVSGCDSVYTLNLTIGNTETTTETINACGSYTWRDGLVYNANNTTATYTETGATAAGCDSVYTLNLTIGNTETAIETITACGSYTWRDGLVYTANNTTAMYIESGATALGCDSIYTLNLNIIANDSITETITECGSYTWKDGIVYSASNTTATFIVTGVTATGCDSVYTLDLTIKSNDSMTETINACESYTWKDGIVYTASNTTATFIVTGATATGCDSVYTLNLSITVVDVTTSLNANVITANATGSTFRWMDCATNTVIAGETNATYAPTENGNYAVEVTTNGCVDTSACVSILTIGIEGLNNFSSVKMYPNPTTGRVVFEANTEIYRIEILSFTGQTVVVFNNTKEIDISSLSQGVYFAKIITEGNSSVIQKLVKK